MYNVVVKSIREVDLSFFQFPQVAVFYKPSDYPDKAVARVFDNGKATNIVMVADTPEVLRKDIRENTSLMWFKRGEEDDKALVGVYL